MEESLQSPLISDSGSSETESEFIDENKICIICKKDTSKSGDVVVLREKGCLGINAAAEARGEQLFAMVGQKAHKVCREKYTNKKDISLHMKRKSAKSSTQKTKKTSLRSSGACFNYREQCLFCGGREDKRKKKKVIEKLKKVLTKGKFQDSVLAACRNRNDEWGTAVLGRIEFVRDCRAGDCTYHNVCFSNFCSGKLKPLRFSSPRKLRKAGRPENLDRELAFFELVEEIEWNVYDSLTVYDCLHIMESKLRGTNSEPYSPPYMKRKLAEHFKECITFCEQKGKADVIMLHSSASKLLSDFHSESQKSNANEEKLRVIRTAAKLILSDIKSLDVDTEWYPNISTLGEVHKQIDCLPESLTYFLKLLICGKKKDVKVASFGQAIAQAVRPRSALFPLQFGVAVHAHRTFGSRGLVDILNKLGFCSSYSQVNQFESSAALTHGIERSELDTTQVLKEGQLQFIADNVDHNIRTLTGHGTFHGMGIMGVTTPAVKAHRRIPRRPVDCDLEKNIGRIGISFYRSQWNGLTSVRFTNMPDVVVADDRHCLDLLWRVSWPLSSPRPGWFGYMQTMVTGDYPGKSSPFFLPLIDMNPSDLTCIYSTLCFVSTEAKKLGVTPIVTFDQPLFWKAQMITHSEKSQFQNMVVRLGMFHTLMSFLGCIGYVMQGSGFRECLEQVYAPNAVTHMLSGKAYARAMRGHELMDAALHAMVLAEAYDMPWILAHLRLDLDTLEAGEDQEIRSLTAQDEEEESGDFDACDPYLTAVMDMEADAMDNAHVDKSVFVDSTEHVTRSYGNEDLDEMGS